MRQKPAIAHARVRLLGAALTGLAAAGGVVEVHTYDQMWHVFTMYCAPRADASNPEQQHSGLAPPSQMLPLTRSGRAWRGLEQMRGASTHGCKSFCLLILRST